MNPSSLLSSLPPHQLQQLEKLTDLFLDWNQKLNLSSIRDREGILLKHIMDSLLILPFQLIQPRDRVLDLGTGGGFPGLPLAIAYPDAEFVLADSTEKKVKVVQAMIQELGLKNAKTVVGRAEELGHRSDLREGFQVVTTRALAEFPVLLEYAIPFVVVGGKLIAYQGPALLQQWKSFQPVAHQLGARIVEVKEAVLPGEQAQRSFIVVEKVFQIDPQYPRRVGLPQKKPLSG